MNEEQIAALKDTAGIYVNLKENLMRDGVPEKEAIDTARYIVLGMITSRPNPPDEPKNPWD